MILGIEDKSGVNFAFAVESIVLIAPAKDSPEHCELYLAHLAGTYQRVHNTVAEFMSKVAEAMNSVQGRATLLGMAGSRKQ